MSVSTEENQKQSATTLAEPNAQDVDMSVAEPQPPVGQESLKIAMMVSKSKAPPTGAPGEQSNVQEGAQAVQLGADGTPPKAFTSTPCPPQGVPKQMGMGHRGPEGTQPAGTAGSQQRQAQVAALATESGPQQLQEIQQAQQSAISNQTALQTARMLIQEAERELGANSASSTQGQAAPLVVPQAEQTQGQIVPAVVAGAQPGQDGQVEMPRGTPFGPIMLAPPPEETVGSSIGGMSVESGYSNLSLLRGVGSEASLSRSWQNINVSQDAQDRYLMEQAAGQGTSDRIIPDVGLDDPTIRR